MPGLYCVPKGHSLNLPRGSSEHPPGHLLGQCYYISNVKQFIEDGHRANESVFYFSTKITLDKSA